MVNDMEKVYFFSVFWWVLYLGMAIALSFIILILVLFPLGISISSDTVFGLLALICFVLSDTIFRKLIKKEMLISKKIPYSILFALIPLCIYIMIFGMGTK